MTLFPGADTAEEIVGYHIAGGACTLEELVAVLTGDTPISGRVVGAACFTVDTAEALNAKSGICKPITVLVRFARKTLFSGFYESQPLRAGQTACRSQIRAGLAL